MLVLESELKKNKLPHVINCGHLVNHRVFCYIGYLFRFHALVPLHRAGRDFVLDYKYRLNGKIFEISEIWI